MFTIYTVVVLQVEQCPCQTVFTCLNIFFVSDDITLHVIQCNVRMVIVNLVCIFYFDCINSFVKLIDALQARLGFFLSRSVTIFDRIANHVQFEHGRILLQQT